MDKWTADDFKAVFRRIAATMEDNKDFLIRLDAAVGDGDLGLTMSQGFKTVAEKLGAGAETDIGKLIALGGMTLAQAVPSTMGTLMASGLMRGGKALQAKTEVTLPELAALFAAVVEGIAARGKAKPGDKTVIDSLQPAADAFQAAADDGKSLACGCQEAYTAASRGVEATKSMVPQHGRAAYYQQKAIGLPDPGATVGMLFVKSFADMFNQDKFSE